MGPVLQGWSKSRKILSAMSHFWPSHSLLVISLGTDHVRRPDGKVSHSETPSRRMSLPLGIVVSG